MESHNDLIDLKRYLWGVDKRIRYLSHDKLKFITLMYAI